MIEERINGRRAMKAAPRQQPLITSLLTKVKKVWKKSAASVKSRYDGRISKPPLRLISCLNAVDPCNGREINAQKSEEAVGRDEAEVVSETAPSVATMVAMFEERKLTLNDGRVKVAKRPAEDQIVGTAAPVAAFLARDEANRRSCTSAVEAADSPGHRLDCRVVPNGGHKARQHFWGWLKHKFHCCKGMSTQIDTSVKVFMACCILMNLCIDAGEQVPPEVVEEAWRDYELRLAEDEAGMEQIDVDEVHGRRPELAATQPPHQARAPRQR
ncbi:hypothetical protein V8C86DRAFT_3025214 [Haematococcus lacustris]